VSGVLAVAVVAIGRIGTVAGDPPLTTVLIVAVGTDRNAIALNPAAPPIIAISPTRETVVTLITSTPVAMATSVSPVISRGG